VGWKLAPSLLVFFISIPITRRGVVTSELSDLASLVAEAILIADGIGQALIEVIDEDGVITLKGTVESEQAILTAEALAQEQAGVVEVINQLKTPDHL
jgi:osmotically-inducible protein OsmY